MDRDKIVDFYLGSFRGKIKENADSRETRRVGGLKASIARYPVPISIEASINRKQESPIKDRLRLSARFISLSGNKFVFVVAADHVT